MSEDFNVFEALRRRYAAPEYAFFGEVRNGTGYERSTRTADGLAMGLWPSRGLDIHGFEVKTYRGDWLREKKMPEKAEEIQRFCDRWWLVVSDPEIVQEGELPPTWGLLVPRGKKLVAKVEAPKLEATPITRLFLASLLRRVFEESPSERAIKAAVEVARKEERDGQVKAMESLQAGANRQIEEVKEQIRAFELASGVKLNRWDAGKIGDAVKVVLEGRVEYHRNQLEHLRNSAKNIAARLDEILVQPAAEPSP